MKLKYIKTAIAVILLMQVTACTDILDKDPVSSFSASGFYKTTADAQAGVYGIYDAAQSVFSYNFCYWAKEGLTMCRLHRQANHSPCSRTT
jgi:hypothetical protein